MTAKREKPIFQQPDRELEEVKNMYFRVYCNVREIEAPNIEAAEQMVKDSLRDFIWLLPVTETPVAPPARAPERPKVKQKKGGHGSMTARH
jgi:hypothetical protein